MSPTDDTRPPRADRHASPAESAASARTPSVQPKVWESDELFGNEVEVFIAHGDQLYRLRRTRNGKLILCK